MNSPIVLILLATIIFDIRLLKAKDKILFRETFYFKPHALWFFCVIFCVAFLAREREFISLFILFFLFPFYLLRRQKLFKTLKQTGRLLRNSSSGFLTLDASGNILFWFAGMILFSIIFSFAPKLCPQNESALGNSVFMTTFSFLLMMALIYKTVSRYSDIKLSEVLGLRLEKKSFLRIFFYPCLVGIIFAFFSSAVIFSRETQPQTPFSEILTTNTSVGVFIAFVMIAVLLAPLLEEVIFRGFFFYVIEKYKGKMVAIVTIAFTFSVLHFHQYWGDWSAISVVSVLGVLLTIMRAKTGSSVASIVAHYTYNGGMTIIPILFLILSNPSYAKFTIYYPQLSFSQKEELLLKSIERQPSHADSYNDLAWIYAEEGRNLAQALQLVDKALSYDPGSAAFWDTKAEILFKMGRIEEAIEIEEEILKDKNAGKYFEEQLMKYKQALK